jgi:hypothetical protein
MANHATPTGAIRPNLTTSEIRWVKEATAVKRLRRHLATIGLQLVITRAGTNQRREWGKLAIVDSAGVIFEKSLNRIEVIDGRHVSFHDQLSQLYTTRPAAEKAAERIGGADLAIVGYDAGLKGGTNDAGL